MAPPAAEVASIFRPTTAVVAVDGAAVVGMGAEAAGEEAFCPSGDAV